MMEHKAFLFDYCGFECELQAILETAIGSSDVSELLRFIEENLSELRDPYKGDSLRGDWESRIEIRDAHQYGDFALTKYYDPSVDIGLGGSWVRIQEMAGNDSAIDESPILGRTVGPRDDPFDPGKLGSYFQDARQVRRSHEYLLEIAKAQRTEHLDEALAMLEASRKREAGLYVTF